MMLLFFVEVWPRFSSLSKRPKSSLMVKFLAQHPVLSFFFGNRQVIQNWEDPEKVLDQALDEMQVEFWITVDPQTLVDLRYP